MWLKGLKMRLLQVILLRPYVKVCSCEKYFFLIAECRQHNFVGWARLLSCSLETPDVQQQAGVLCLPFSEGSAFYASVYSATGPAQARFLIRPVDGLTDLFPPSSRPVSGEQRLCIVAVLIGDAGLAASQCFLSPQLLFCRMFYWVLLFLSQQIYGWYLC